VRHEKANAKSRDSTSLSTCAQNVESSHVAFQLMPHRFFKNALIEPVNSKMMQCDSRTFGVRGAETRAEREFKTIATFRASDKVIKEHLIPEGVLDKAVQVYW
jgi:hypothetical protein